MTLSAENGERGGILARPFGSGMVVNKAKRMYCSFKAESNLRDWTVGQTQLSAAL